MSPSVEENKLWIELLYSYHLSSDHLPSAEVSVNEFSSSLPSVGVPRVDLATSPELVFLRAARCLLQECATISQLPAKHEASLETPPKSAISL